MKKLLVGNIGVKSNRGALGVFVAKKDSKVMEYENGYCFLIGNDKQKNKIEMRFGKDYVLRAVTDDDVKLESVKLSDIKWFSGWGVLTSHLFLTVYKKNKKRR